MDKYPSFPKIARFNRDIIISEKLDGTSGLIEVTDGTIRAGSRNRWITPTDDNFGFASWVEDNKISLITTLGDGLHYGEWWGRKIARTYGKTDRTFSLFNTSRWTEENTKAVEGLSVVPTLYAGPFSEGYIKSSLLSLSTWGSVAVPGFMRPEGVVVFHTASNSMFKVTLENDEKPKGQP